MTIIKKHNNKRAIGQRIGEAIHYQNAQITAEHNLSRMALKLTRHQLTGVQILTYFQHVTTSCKHGPCIKDYQLICKFVTLPSSANDKFIIN